MIIIGTMMLVSLSGCDKIAQVAEELISEEIVTGWEYSSNVDKFTNKQVSSATKRFVDEQVERVVIDVVLKCDGDSALTATVATYDSLADKDGNLSGVPIKTTGDGEETVLVETKSGPNQLLYLANLENYSNQMVFNVAIPNQNSLLSAQLAFIGIKIHKESASMMVDSQWLMRVKTDLGNPTITIDLNDPSVKKVTSQCKWIPAFSSSAPTGNIDESNAQ